MRVWDVSAGYLNRGSLLGEHRELHGVHVILAEGKQGYSRHPETRRWVGATTGLAERHALLAAEMALRGYTDRTPIPRRRAATWPVTFVTDPGDQFTLLRAKYERLAAGRIPLPRNVQELWAQHKYSVMARDPDAYRQFGRAVARMRSRDALRELARDLVLALRAVPPAGRLHNALEHMWGYVSDAATEADRQCTRDGTRLMLLTIQRLAVAIRQPFLLSSTALSELAVYA
jgi:hypothetical protein